MGGGKYHNGNDILIKWNNGKTLLLVLKKQREKLF
jgi:hypothetical protein